MIPNTQHTMVSSKSERVQRFFDAIKKLGAQRFEALAQQHLAGLGEAYYVRGRQRLEGLRRWAAGRVGQAPDMESEED